MGVAGDASGARASGPGGTRPLARLAARTAMTAEPGSPPWRIVPSGDRCLVVEFDEQDVLRANTAAAQLAQRIWAAGLPGIREVVPSMVAVAVHYRIAPWCDGASPREAWYRLSEAIAALVPREGTQRGAAGARERVVPVCYGGEYGEDLPQVARHCGVSESEFIALHSERWVRVLMLGFAPGHPYIGFFDERLSIGRRATPRTAVPAGSIGLANRQSAIYPDRMPGGWNLIGRTPLRMFDPAREDPCLLHPGDLVRFVPITGQRFVELAGIGATA